jgi:hypothetical protein
MLTVLPALMLCADFIAEPLAARGLLIERTIADGLVLVLLAMLVPLSQRPGAIISISLGLAAIIASLAFGKQWPPIAGTLLRRGGASSPFPRWLGSSVTPSMRPAVSLIAASRARLLSILVSPQSLPRLMA